MSATTRCPGGRPPGARPARRSAGGPGESADGPGADPHGDGDAGWSPAEAVRAYRERTSMIGARQRVTSLTGVFTGAYALNPATGGQIPVFLPDYVLMGYRTRALMAVPAHDERDRHFARPFGLPVTQVARAAGPAHRPA